MWAINRKKRVGDRALGRFGIFRFREVRAREEREKAKKIHPWMRNTVSWGASACSGEKVLK